MATSTTAAVGTPGNASYINPFAPTVPTSAPTNQIAVTQPPATASPTSSTSPTQTPVPTAVVSSSTAQNHIDNTIVPTLNNAQQDIQNQKSTTLAQDQQKAANQGKPGYDVLGNPISKSITTPEQQIADTPDSGNQWIYDTQGNRTQVPVGSTIPAGYSSTNPTVSPTTPQSDTTTDSSGNTYIQYSDGTYGKLDPSGNYAGTVSAKVFQDAKTASGLLDSIKQAVNGTYPLTADQQAQITSLQAQFQKLIKDQEVANANLTGGTTVAENLYGMGNSVTGLGEIKGSIDSGLAKVADLNNKMVQATAQMTASFNSDNRTALKEAYQLYDDASKQRQAEIDKVQATAQKAITAQTAANTSINEAAAKKYQDTEEPILPSDTPADRIAKLQTSPTYQQDLKTKNGQIDQDVLDGMLKIYNKTGAIPAAVGAASLPLKKAFYAAIGGNTNLADESASNKAALTAATKSLTTQQTQYSATQTSVGTLKSSMTRVEGYLKPLVDTGSPVLNGPLRDAAGKIGGSTTYSAFENEINTIATEYGKIISGASASIAGVSVQSVEDIKTALNTKVTVGQLETVLDAMRQDVNARLTSQKGTIDQINQDIHDIGGSDNTTSTDKSGSGTVSGNTYSSSSGKTYTLPY